MELEKAKTEMALKAAQALELEKLKAEIKVVA